MPEAAPGGTDIFEIMHTLRAMRRLKPDPVPDDLIRKILLAGQAAASGGNTQRWRFLVLKDPAKKKAVQVYYKKAFDEVVGPALCVEPAAAGLRPGALQAPALGGRISDRPLPRSAGVDRRLPRGRRQSRAHGRLVDLPGGAEHAAGGARARPRLDADHPAHRL